MPQFNKYGDEAIGWRFGEFEFDSWQEYTLNPSPERPNHLVTHQPPNQ
jgi:hypothetical protein